MSDQTADPHDAQRIREHLETVSAEVHRASTAAHGDPEAVRILLQRTALTAFHMSGKKILESSMRFRNPNVSMGLPGLSEYEICRTDPESIRAVRRLLQ